MPKKKKDIISINSIPWWVWLMCGIVPPVGAVLVYLYGTGQIE